MNSDFIISATKKYNELSKKLENDMLEEYKNITDDIANRIIKGFVEINLKSKERLNYLTKTVTDITKNVDNFILHSIESELKSNLMDIVLKINNIISIIVKEDSKDSIDIIKVVYANFDEINKADQVRLRLTAEILMLKGDYEEAISCYDKALKMSPKDIEAFVGKGKILRKQGKYSKAHEYFDKALEINANDSAALVGKALTLSLSVYDLGNKENYDEAIKYCDQALDNNSKDINALICKGRVLKEKKDYQGSLQCLNAAIDINPQDPRVIVNLGKLLYIQDKSEEAIFYYDKAIKINSEYTKAYYCKGIALTAKGNFNDAYKCYDKALEINPNDTSTLYAKAWVLNSEGKPDESIKCCDKGLKVNPNDTDILYQKVLAFYNKYECDLAITYCNKILKLNPENIDALLQQGRNIGKKMVDGITSSKDIDQKLVKEAISYYDIALEIDPFCVEALVLKGKTILTGTKVVDKKLINEIITNYYDKAIEIDPKCVAAYKQKAFELNSLFEYDDAFFYWNKVVEMSPCDIEGLCEKGYLLVRFDGDMRDLNRYNEALICFEKALELDSSNLKVLLGKGKVYIEILDFDNAIKSFKQALNVDSKDDRALKGKAKAYCLKGKKIIQEYCQLVYEKKVVNKETYTKQALNCFDESLKTIPNNIDALEEKGKALEKLKNYKGAMQCYEKICQIKKHFLRGLICKGWLQYNQGNYTEALKIFNAIIIAYKNSLDNLYDAYLGAAAVHMKTGYYQDSIQCYIQALNLDSTNPKIFTDLGEAHRLNGNYQKAIMCYNEALKRDANYAPAIEGKKKCEGSSCIIF